MILSELVLDIVDYYPTKPSLNIPVLTHDGYLAAIAEARRGPNEFEGESWWREMAVQLAEEIERVEAEAQGDAWERDTLT